MIVRVFPDLPGWQFEVEEVSANAYRVRGHDQAGRSIELSGTLDPAPLIEEARRWAFEHRNDSPTRRA
jgi:hypothetical protein